MDSETSFLVPCKEVFVKSPDGRFQRGSIWGEPDIDVAADLMRMAVEKPSAFAEVGQRGRNAVLRKLSAKAVAANLASYFEDTE
jgi:hypothetical protein